MTKGYIYGDRYALKWLPEKKDLLLGLWAVGGTKLGEGGGLFERPRVEAHMCHACNKYIIDMNEENHI
jgi:hypothetical protein